MKTFKLFTIAIILVSTFACKKKTETFYFNCYINGQFFSPSNKMSLGYYPLTAKLLYENTQLRLHADNGNEYLNIFIYSKDSSQIQNKSYQFGNAGTTKTVAFYNSILTDSINNIGIINISQLDTENMIVEGNFYFDAYNPALNDTIHITDGKFRLKYDLH